MTILTNIIIINIISVIENCKQQFDFPSRKDNRLFFTDKYFSRRIGNSWKQEKTGMIKQGK